MRRPTPNLRPAVPAPLDGDVPPPRRPHLGRPAPGRGLGGRGRGRRAVGRPVGGVDAVLRRRQQRVSDRAAVSWVGQTTDCPTVDVEPNTGLADGQFVYLTATNFDPTGSIRVAFCSAVGSTSDPTCLNGNWETQAAR